MLKEFNLSRTMFFFGTNGILYSRRTSTSYTATRVLLAPPGNPTMHYFFSKQF